MPFLKRNFARAVNVFSGAWGSPVLTRGEDGLPRENGDHPRKRRRLSSPDNDMDKLVASPRSSDARPTLRIEILRCHHRESKKVRHSFGAVVSPDATSKASCRITISAEESGHSRILHCERQPCNIVTFKNPAGPHRVARVELPRPFYVPRDSISVNRLDDETWGLADAYRLSVELESADGDVWPPLKGEDLGNPLLLAQENTRTKHWVLSGSFNELFGRLKSPLLLKNKLYEYDSIETEFEMDIDLQWTTGFMTLKRLENGAKPCIAAFDAKETRVNGHRGEEEVDEIMHDIDGDGHEAENGINGDDTPSRSLRTRGGDKNYNLKALSDKAHGRKRRQRKSNHSDRDDGRVKYFLPPQQPLCLDGFRCVSCGVFHQSLKHLQLHLQNIHSDYDFELAATGQGPPQFHVTSQPDPPTTPCKTMSLKPSVKPFDLGAYVSGDMTWLDSRLEEDSKDLFYTSPASKAAWATIISTANQSPTKKAPSTATEVKPTPTKQKIKIPETQQVFYHPVSKQVLKPGQAIPETIAETNWFHHRQREGLNDITDITPAELEFIKEFDSVMREHDISARAYFPRAWLDFVSQKAAWLVEAKHRMIEFSMHESYLLASDLIEQKHIQEAMALIDEERAKRDKLRKISPDGEEVGDQPEKRNLQPPPKIPPTRGSSSGCAVCRLPVLSSPHTLLCSNKVGFPMSPQSLLIYFVLTIKQDCSQRLFHAKCVSSAPKSRQAKRDWLCEKCDTTSVKGALGPP